MLAVRFETGSYATSVYRPKPAPNTRLTSEAYQSFARPDVGRDARGITGLVAQLLSGPGSLSSRLVERYDAGAVAPGVTIRRSPSIRGELAYEPPRVVSTEIL